MRAIGTIGAGARRSWVARGWKSGGSAPYGYVWTKNLALEGPRKILVPAGDQAEILRRIFSGYLHLRSIAKVVRLLAAQGTPPRWGKGWSSAAIVYMLRNRFYLGYVRDGECWKKGHHEAIVAPIVFYKVGVLLRRNRKR